MPEFIGSPLGEGRRVALICSRFNIEIVQRLHDGAYTTAMAQGVSEHDIDVFWVPGAWEIPVVVRRLLETERYDALVTLGAVIRGDTPHFDFVAGETSRGVQALSLEFGVPIAFGVLTTDTDAQAEERAAVVAWLRSQAESTNYRPRTCLLADAIERRAYDTEEGT